MTNSKNANQGTETFFVEDMPVAPLLLLFEWSWCCCSPYQRMTRGQQSGCVKDEATHVRVAVSRDAALGMPTNGCDPVSYDPLLWLLVCRLTVVKCLHVVYSG